jgi:hypothetical protein
MTMKNIVRYYFIGVLLILGLFFSPVDSVAVESVVDDALLEGAQISKQYLVNLSGTVMNETFSGARALLTLGGASPVSRYDNPYLVTIQGFPKNNSRNSFFWNSGYTEMTAIANEITCDIKRTFVKQVPTYFMFLSPDLLKHTGALEMKAGDEGKKLAESVALPTLIIARAGKLKLRLYSNTVSGTVWMKGYDPVEKSFVLYSARLYGKKSYNLKPKQEGKKGTVAGVE